MRLLALALALLLPPLPAAPCALELILAIDVSGSIDSNEFDLQSSGLASAFEDPSLITAIEALEGGALVTVTQWSGKSRSDQVTAWHRLTDARSMAALAAEIRAAGRVWRNFSTAIGEALIHAAEVSATAPETCKRRVIDVSGDGVSNEGTAPSEVSRLLAAKGYIINGLVIRGAQPDPVAHYRAEVIAGPGAFVEVARDFTDYPRAILRKLLREIDQPMILSAAGSGPTSQAPAGAQGR
jgi:Ca-activated chloride channel family protein